MSGPYVMILRGLVDARGQHQPTEYDGQFLKDFDFEAGEGRGMLDMTPDLTKAKQFATMADLIEFRNRVPECKPVREDGLPNRPLTATTWEMAPVGPAD